MTMGRKIVRRRSQYSREGIVFAPLLPGEGETDAYAAGRPARRAAGFDRFDLSGIDEYMFERDNATMLTPEYYGITHGFSAIPASAFGAKNDRGHLLMRGTGEAPVKEADVRAGLTGKKKQWSYGYLVRESGVLRSRAERNRRDEALLLLHCCNGSARKFWGLFPESLAQAGKCDVFLYNYPTSRLPGSMGIYAGFFCARRPAPYELAAAMELAVAQVLSGYKKVLILAYGPGCAVAREFILKCGRDGKGAVKFGGALFFSAPDTCAQWAASIRSLGRPVMISACKGYLESLHRDWKRYVRADGCATQIRPGMSYKMYKSPGIEGGTLPAGGVRIIEASCRNFISPGGVRESLLRIILQLLSEVRGQVPAVGRSRRRGGLSFPLFYKPVKRNGTLGKSMPLLLLCLQLCCMPSAGIAGGAALKEWTVLVFLNGKNNLEEFALKDLNEMETAGSTDEVNIVAELGRSRGYYAGGGDWAGVRRYLVVKDGDTH